MSERYRLVRLLGGGGMAEVYLAFAVGAEGFEKPIAIKRVLPHLARHEQIARMFITEAKLSTHLHHQNIVQVFDVGRGPEGLFLAMELVNGWDLSVIFDQCVKQKVMIPQVLAVYLAAQIADGLSHAYRRTQDGRPLIAAHRDISPSNILLSVEGEVKVADFGIARLEQRSEGTAPGTFKGKIPYAAPEVIRGEPATPASDQFGLGIILHKMLVGRHPFGQMENLYAYAEALAKAAPPAMQGIPPQLAEIVRRMLRMKPEERFASSEEVSQALNAYLATTGVPASAGELARFLHTLELPKTPLELLDEKVPAPLPSLPPTLIKGFGIEFSPDEGSDWQSPGVALDASGRLERPAPAPAPEAAARFASIEGPPSPIMSLADSVMPEAASPAAPSSPASGIELADSSHLSSPALRALPPEDLGREASSRGGGRTAVKIILTLVALGVLAGGVGLVALNTKVRTQIQRTVNSELRAGEAAPVLRIDSTPDGATVKINGEDKGRTPLFLENTWPADQQIEVKLYRPGYKVWTGTFTGGVEATVEGKLVRAH